MKIKYENGIPIITLEDEPKIIIKNPTNNIIIESQHTNLVIKNEQCTKMLSQADILVKCEEWLRIYQDFFKKLISTIINSVNYTPIKITFTTSANEPWSISIDLYDIDLGIVKHGPKINIASRNHQIYDYLMICALNYISTYCSTTNFENLKINDTTCKANYYDGCAVYTSISIFLCFDFDIYHKKYLELAKGVLSSSGNYDLHYFAKQIKTQQLDSIFYESLEDSKRTYDETNNNYFKR